MRGPRRVLYVNHVAEISGAEGSLLALIRHLDRRRFEPRAAVPLGPLAGELEELGLAVERIPAFRAHRPRGLLQAIAASVRLKILAGNIRRVGEELGCDLIHANSIVAGIASVMAWGGQRPVVWHARDLRAPARAERWLTRRTTRIIAISSAVVDHLLQVDPRARERITLVHNGIDPDDFVPSRPREQVRTELGVPADAPLVGTVGQLVPWKRQDMFIHIAAKALVAVPACRFIVVGADLFGEHPDYVAGLRELAAELGVADRVIFAGYREDMPNVMSALDVLVHTAGDEPLGRVLLEAMCLGVPCVAARSAGPAEIIEHGVSGLLVDADDVAAYAREVVSLLRNPVGAARLGEAARERATTKFSAQRTALLTEEVYEEALTEALLH